MTQQSTTPIPQDEWQAPSWDEIVAQHSARVYRLAYRLTGNSHDAEDLTQEVFVRVFRSLSSYTPGTFEGWLHRITTNLFLDQARRKAKIRFDALAEDAETRIPSRAAAPDIQVLDGLSTTTWSPRSPSCRPTSGPPWCCATSRVSATRRSRTSCRSSSARSAPGSTAAARCSARLSRTARPAPVAPATPGPRTRVAVHS
jgi:RNA polymerase sigma factor (sigma-70 family)